MKQTNPIQNNKQGYRTMIIICNQIKDFSTYARTGTKRVIEPIGINIQNIVTFSPMNLWKEGSKTTQITRMEMKQEEPVYLEHDFEEIRAMLFGITCVHDYRVEHGTHYIRCEAFPTPQDVDGYDETDITHYI